jgi:hypothetical protein
VAPSSCSGSVHSDRERALWGMYLSNGLLTLVSPLSWTQQGWGRCVLCPPVPSTLHTHQCLMHSC